MAHAVGGGGSNKTTKKLGKCKILDRSVNVKLYSCTKWKFCILKWFWVFENLFSVRTVPMFSSEQLLFSVLLIKMG